MSGALLREYRRQRKDWRASVALSYARTKLEFAALEDETVRLVWHPDETPYDDSYIDTWTDVSEARRERARKDLWDSIKRNGVWGLIAEARCDECEQWSRVDSCWGFIGQDASGYEFDLMASALDAVRS